MSNKTMLHLLHVVDGNIGAALNALDDDQQENGPNEDLERLAEALEDARDIISVAVSYNGGWNEQG